MKCMEPTTLKESKPTGRNPKHRIDGMCATNKRNMERKVKRRAATDPLVSWWKKLPDDSAKEVRWYKKMKHNKLKHERMSDEQIMTEVAETQSSGIEKRGRSEYFGYATIEEEHPDWSEEKCLEHWSKLVEKSKDKIVLPDGEVMIARARKVIIDEVDSNMHSVSIKKARVLGSDSDLKGAMCAGAASEDRFKRIMQATSRAGKSHAVPAEAKNVEAIEGNVTDSVEAALSKRLLQHTLEQEMVQTAVEQAAEDEELMWEAVEDIERAKAAKKAAKKDEQQTPEGTKRLVSNLNTFLIEKSAKLDSSVVRLRGELAMPALTDAQLSHLAQAEADDANASHKKHKEEAEAALKAYSDKAKAWKQANSLDTLAPGGRLSGEFDDIVKTALEGFKDFFAKDGHQKDFRSVMSSWKKLMGGLDKERKAWERASAKSSLARAKLNGVNTVADEQLAVIAALEKEVDEGGCFENKGTTGTIGEFPTKAWLSADGFKAKLNALGKSASFVTQEKWLKTRCSKEGEEYMNSAITNRKLYSEVAAAFEGMDPAIARDDRHLFVKFPAQHESLKKGVVDYQVAAICSGYQNVSVASFCLPEVRACVKGAHWVVGLDFDSLDGESIRAKLASVHKMSWGDLMGAMSPKGFAHNLVEGQVLAVPAGMIVLTLGPKDGHCIMVRWSTLRAQDFEAAHKVLLAMLQDYPYLGGTDYETLKDLMQAAKNTSK